MPKRKKTATEASNVPQNCKKVKKDDVPSRSTTRINTTASGSAITQKVSVVEMKIFKMDAAVWSKILRFVSLKDLMAVYEVQPSIVKRYAGGNGDIQIDNEFIRAFPINSNKDLYKKIADMTTKLTLSSAYAVVDNPIFKCFNNVRHLTLIGSQLLAASSIRHIRNYPLVSLRLVNFEMRKHLQCWINSMQKTLTSVQLIYETPRMVSVRRSKNVYKMITKADGFFDLSQLPELRQLTYDGQEFPHPSLKGATDQSLQLLHTLKIKVKILKANDSLFNLADLKRLSISAEQFPLKKFKVCLPSLEHYSLVDTEWDWKTGKQQMAMSQGMVLQSEGLKSLVLPGCTRNFQWLAHFKRLESLILRQPLKEANGWEKAAIDELMKLDPKLRISYTVQICPVNLLRLNDDCILAIMDKLNKDDLLSFRLVDPRLKQLFPLQARKTWGDKIEFNHGYLNSKLHSSLEGLDALQEIAPSIRVIVDIKNEKKAVSILQCFKNITKLKLVGDGFKMYGAIKTFPQPEEAYLRITHCSQLSTLYCERLLKHFNEKLTKLTIYGGLSNLSPLHNIQELYICADALQLNLSQFWAQNKQLRLLEIEDPYRRYQRSELLYYDVNYYCDKQNWLDIATLTHLKHLAIKICSFGAINIYGLPQFPHVETLEYTSPYSDFVKNMGTNLKNLIVSETYKNVFGDISHLKSLEKLTLHGYKVDEDMPNIGVLLQFKLLRELAAHISIGLTQKLIVELPELEKITNFGPKVEDFYNDELKFFLLKKKRVVYYNETALPLSTDETDLSKCP